MVVENASFGCALNFKVRMLLKGAGHSRPCVSKTYFHQNSKEGNFNANKTEDCDHFNEISLYCLKIARHWHLKSKGD